MTRQLVLVHGRSQQGKDPGALKAEWLDALGEGLAKSGLTLPIDEQDVRFPFYGDTLDDLVRGRTPDEAARVLVRGNDTDDDQQRFMREVLDEIRKQNGITEDQLAEVAGQEVITKGPLNWEWLQAILQAVDRHVPFGSGTSLALTTHDVYQYLRTTRIGDTVDAGVRAAMTPGTETVVVGHSLGSVVAYRILRSEGSAQGWSVPLLVTVGSPLAVTEIRRQLKSDATLRVPECVSRWHNAMDDRDVVSLYPLTPEHFPIDPDEPAIENRTDVRNRTTNRHGIAGYLDNRDVARLIHDALTA